MNKGTITYKQTFAYLITIIVGLPVIYLCIAISLSMLASKMDFFIPYHHGIYLPLMVFFNIPEFIFNHGDYIENVSVIRLCLTIIFYLVVSAILAAPLKCFLKRLKVRFLSVRKGMLIKIIFIMSALLISDICKFSINIDRKENIQTCFPEGISIYKLESKLKEKQNDLFITDWEYRQSQNMVYIFVDSPRSVLGLLNDQGNTWMLYANVDEDNETLKGTFK